MNNYYDVLGLTAFESSQETIEQAYKEGTQRMSEVINSDWAGQLVLFNEAYLVLSDVALKQHYDYSLRYNSPSTYLEQGIEEKRKRAKAFVESKLSLTVPLRKESSMSTLVKVLIVVAVAMLCAILTALVQDSLPDSDLPFMRALIMWIVITTPACLILAKKDRGAGYYILAFLIPLVGLIVALCLKKLPAEEQPQTQAVDLDITKETRKK